MVLTDPCAFCGADFTERAFVKYEAAPNGDQQECDWIENTPDVLYSIVCTDCGMSQGCLDARHKDALPDTTDGGGASSYRVDEELE